MGGVDMEAAESLFQCLGQVADPRKPGGVHHPFQAILRLTMLGSACGQTTLTHIALFARMHWTTLKEPLDFVRDHPSHVTTISHTLAGVSYEQLQCALTGWVARVVSDQEMSASVDGKWAKQSTCTCSPGSVSNRIVASGCLRCRRGRTYCTTVE